MRFPAIISALVLVGCTSHTSNVPTPSQPSPFEVLKNFPGVPPASFFLEKGFCESTVPARENFTGDPRLYVNQACARFIEGSKAIGRFATADVEDASHPRILMIEVAVYDASVSPPILLCELTMNTGLWNRDSTDHFEKNIDRECDDPRSEAYQSMRNLMEASIQMLRALRQQ